MALGPDPTLNVPGSWGEGPARADEVLRGDASGPRGKTARRVEVGPQGIHLDAEKDDPINAGIRAFEPALKANRAKCRLFTYPSTQHGFNDDTTPRYDKAAADLVWKRTMNSLELNLRARLKAATRHRAVGADPAQSFLEATSRAPCCSGRARSPTRRSQSRSARGCGRRPRRPARCD